jgi:hypothetical protein
MTSVVERGPELHNALRARALPLSIAARRRITRSARSALSVHHPHRARGHETSHARAAKRARQIEGAGAPRQICPASGRGRLLSARRAQTRQGLANPDPVRVVVGTTHPAVRGAMTSERNPPLQGLFGHPPRRCATAERCSMTVPTLIATRYVSTNARAVLQRLPEAWARAQADSTTFNVSVEGRAVRLP